MIEHLFAIVLIWMHMLAPGRNVDALAWAVAVNARDIEEAARITAVAFRESSLRNDAIGDNGHAVCAMQIYDGPPTLLENPIACVTRGTSMLRTSARVDAVNPIAWYARGPRWRSDEAQRISRDRMVIAARLVRSVPR